MERIAPGCPRQNGQHERTHRTLKAEAASPPCADLTLQQVRFDVFRSEFNEERPHQALGKRVPASADAASSQRYPERLAEVAYDPEHAVRRVRTTGRSSGRAGCYLSARRWSARWWAWPRRLGAAGWCGLPAWSWANIDALRRRLTRQLLGWRNRPVDLMESASARSTTPQAQHEHEQEV